MSPSPTDLSDQGGVARYGESWGQIMAAVRGGASWSGSERNRCFKNQDGQGFTDVTDTSGLGFKQDGRAMAVCDWDRDGDQDVWLRNRSAPRLRLMLNRSEGGRSIALKLEGTRCNRDAVGAVVELTVGGRKIVRSVRAGEMFLSQSSKWLHFGLGEDGPIERATVRWPGGAEESFAGLTAGGRFILREGSAVAEPDARLESPPIASRSAPIAAGKAGARGIYLPLALPLPPIAYRDPAAKASIFSGEGGPKLLLIWESSSAECAQVLADLQQGAGALRSAGVGVLALAVDGIETAGAAYERIDAASIAAPWGFVDSPSLGSLWDWQAALFDRRPAARLPFGLLVDSRGRVVALYRGAIEVGQIVEDATRLLDIDAKTRWHLAPPLAGTWFTNPPPESFVRASIEARMRPNFRD